MVTLGSVQVSLDAARVAGHGCQASEGRQPGRAGERGEVACGGREELRTQDGTEAGQTLEDLGLGVSPEGFGDLLGEVFDLAVQIEQLSGQPRDQRDGGGLGGQRDVLRSAAARALAVTMAAVVTRTLWSMRYWANSCAPVTRIAVGV